MDGRVQLPVIAWLKQEYQLDYVDMITEAGPNRILSGRVEGLVESVRERVLISVRKHGSTIVAVVAHGDCAGNPVPSEENIRQLRESMKVVSSWALPVSIVGLWIDEVNWEVALIDVM